MTLPQLNVITLNGAGEQFSTLSNSVAWSCQHNSGRRIELLSTDFSFCKYCTVEANDIYATKLLSIGQH